MADTVVAFTPEQVAYIDRRFGELARQIRNVVPDTGPGVQPMPDMIGKVVTAVTAGPLDPETYKFQPKKGPAHDSPDDDAGIPLGIDYAWADLSTEDWAGFYDWFGLKYVSLLKCASGET